MAEQSWVESQATAATEWEEVEMTRMTTSGGKEEKNDDSAVHRASLVACSFESLWTRLTAFPLIDAKAAAREAIDQSRAAGRRRRRPTLLCFGSGASRQQLPPALADEQLLIVTMTKVPYNDSDSLHWELLYSVYKHMINDRSNQSRVPRIGAHWETIGFQGDDPATDLRGVGIFGLCQLLFLISEGLNSQMVAKLLDLSRDDRQNFPLSVVGLNFTKMIIDRLKQGKLNKLILKENSCITIVNGIYRGCFLIFYRMWVSRKCTILDFNAVSTEINDTVKRRPKYLLNMANLPEA
uniref:ELMO domain-containing protein n=1 Tax=Plectus sambesii TaxID=2011161 RepID=A0A914XSK0_9BILA